jgi:uncharacterized protein YhfF
MTIEVQGVMDGRSKVYLDRFLHSLPLGIASKYISFGSDYYCADEYNANVCADLIVRGEKQASCSMKHWYSYEGEAMPQVGHLQVVTNWDGKPVCIIEITSVTECRYCDVSAEFAAAEGEGDKTLDWWREAHWAFFSAECEELDIDPSEDMLQVLERFKVVYQ